MGETPETWGQSALQLIFQLGASQIHVRIVTAWTILICFIMEYRHNKGLSNYVLLIYFWKYRIIQTHENDEKYTNFIHDRHRVGWRPEMLEMFSSGYSTFLSPIKCLNVRVGKIIILSHEVYSYENWSFAVMKGTEGVWEQEFWKMFRPKKKKVCVNAGKVHNKDLCSLWPIVIRLTNSRRIYHACIMPCIYHAWKQ
jgi:hypothetical protein